MSDESNNTHTTHQTNHQPTTRTHHRSGHFAEASSIVQVQRRLLSPHRRTGVVQGPVNAISRGYHRASLVRSLIAHVGDRPQPISRRIATTRSAVVEIGFELGSKAGGAHSAARPHPHPSLPRHRCRPCSALLFSSSGIGESRTCSHPNATPHWLSSGSSRVVKLRAFLLFLRPNPPPLSTSGPSSTGPISSPRAAGEPMQMHARFPCSERGPGRYPPRVSFPSGHRHFHWPALSAHVDGSTPSTRSTRHRTSRGARSTCLALWPCTARQPPRPAGLACPFEADQPARLGVRDPRTQSACD